MHPKKRFSISLSIAVIALIAIATRSLLLSSDKLLLDADECTIAIMAHHQYQFGEVSPFFWGQAYGFTLVETSMIAIAYSFTGMTDYAVKAAMLVLWIASVIMFYLALLRLSDKHKWFALFVVLLMVLSPTWGLWSLKARGGYLTSFLVHNIVLYILFSKKLYSRNYYYILIGFLLLVMYEAQSLWLASILPLLLYRLFSEKSKKKAAILLASFAGGLVPTLIYQSHLPKTHYLLFPDFNECIQNIARIPTFFYHNLHGRYFLDILLDGGEFQLFASVFFVLTGLLLIAASIYAFVKKDYLAACAVLSVLIVLCSSIISVKVEPRYLLPAMGAILFLLYILAIRINKFIVLTPLVVIISIVGAVDFYGLKDFSFCDARKDSLQKLIGYLESKHINCVYSADWMLHNLIMFYSQERITARQIELPDRYPNISMRVDSMLYNHPQSVAIVNYDGHYGKIKFPPGLVTVGGYYVYVKPTLSMVASEFMIWKKFKR